MDILKCFDVTPETCIPMPYIIAEAGVNHEGSMDLAKRLIREAKEGGADAIKFQSYKAGTLASKDSPAYWDTTKEPTKSQYELFKNKGIVVGEGNDSLVRKCLVDTDSGLVKQGEPSVWWLRSLSMDWNAGFAAVTAEGDPYSSWFSDYALGVVPGFCV